MNDTLFQAATLILPLIFAIVFHEVAHGMVARWRGDPTADQLNRLSLNPLRHVDPFGTVILPGMLALMKAPVFGWAKPVPVNPARLRKPRWDMVLVALAGPGTNLLLVGLTTLVLWLAGGRLGTDTVSAFIVVNLINFIQINLFLAFFNMLPVPPFDGSRVLAGFLPDGPRRWFQGLDRYALMIMVVMLLLLPRLGPQFDVIGKLVLPPVDWAYGHVIALLTGR